MTESPPTLQNLSPAAARLCLEVERFCLTRLGLARGSRLLLALVPGGEAVSGQVFEPDDGRQGGWSHYEMARAIGWAMGRLWRRLWE